MMPTKTIVDEQAQWRGRVLRALHTLRRQQSLSELHLRDDQHRDESSRRVDSHETGRRAS